MPVLLTGDGGPVKSVLSKRIETVPLFVTFPQSIKDPFTVFTTVLRLFRLSLCSILMSPGLRRFFIYCFPGLQFKYFSLKHYFTYFLRFHNPVDWGLRAIISKFVIKISNTYVIYFEIFDTIFDLNNFSKTFPVSRRCC